MAAFLKARRSVAWTALAIVAGKIGIGYTYTQLCYKMRRRSPGIAVDEGLFTRGVLNRAVGPLFFFAIMIPSAGMIVEEAVAPPLASAQTATKRTLGSSDCT